MRSWTRTCERSRRVLSAGCPSSNQTASANSKRRDVKTSLGVYGFEWILNAEDHTRSELDSSLSDLTRPCTLHLPSCVLRDLRSYVELHTASAFSFLQGASLPEALVDRAAELGYPALALLDRDGVYGAPRFHKAARAAGIRPIIGAELTITGSLRSEVKSEVGSLIAPQTSNFRLQTLRGCSPSSANPPRGTATSAG